MHVTIVYASVKPEKVEAFKKACRLNHENSILEPGNVRFDILQSTDDPTKFVFYEAYKTQQDALAHKETAHYLAWRNTVADWMAEPRQGVPYQGLYPVVNG
ncbi:antibiotic biosynthesis monooxygenase [Nitrosomonas supralitoralis]|uniref:Antibiotic biosynthesis monooxygenase n=1 Tax=Nitrosomonas supralitoralis TaxID=2116706 RepID=A0A2P7NY24_9PROT|nr:antibiotic biosynthesis monooxygenase [Nitrosomonas supralitoralis]PSJ18381.1 antibiotic biosynthesis monooxygenase [Nitrosomonas supralitoralis]